MVKTQKTLPGKKDRHKKVNYKRAKIRYWMITLKGTEVVLEIDMKFVTKIGLNYTRLTPTEARDETKCKPFMVRMDGFSSWQCRVVKAMSMYHTYL